MNYIVRFQVLEYNKIQFIKFFMTILDLDLKDAKDFVEQKFEPFMESFMESFFTLRLTEKQLGRFFIAEHISKIKGYSFRVGLQLNSVEEEPRVTYLDCTSL